MAVDPKLYRLLFETFKGELTEQYQVMVDTLIELEKAKTFKKAEELLEVLFRTSHNLKGAAKSVSVDDISSIAHHLEDQFTYFRETKKRPTKKQINDCLILADQMVQALEAAEKRFSASEFSLDEMLRVPLRRVDRINAKLNELIMFQLRLSNWNKQINAIIGKLDKAMVHDAQGLDHVRKGLTQLFDDAERLAGEFSRNLFTLQQEGRRMRLLPMSHVFSPLERVVREVSEELGKSVKLVVHGGAVEIDKSVLDALKSPLQHLIRNAIAHGVEEKSTRKEQGKPETATISIGASNEANQIRLVVSDDGQGIDIEKIKAKALEKELYTEKELSQLKRAEVLELIFHSGLSTAGSVSELSGRGVGMDAVLSDIKRVKGTIRVESTDGEGCTFSVTLPLALASSRGLFVRVSDSQFMLPTVSLDALYEIKSTQLERIDNRWAVVIHDEPIAVASLSDILGLSTGVLDAKKTYTGILLGSGHSPLIVLIDEIVEEHDCVLKPLPKPFDQLKYLSGATLTETGELVLAIDVEHILEKANSGAGFTLSLENRELPFTEQEQEQEQEQEVKQVLRVLVVDDALTTRTLAINALHAAGYETLGAENGEKAWDLLQNKSVDCVITDIEMPLMNGFQLTENIKGDEKLAHLPVVIVSACETEEDKKQGMALGASAYLVKREFDTRKLIDMVESLL